MSAGGRLFIRFGIDDSCPALADPQSGGGGVLSPHPQSHPVLAPALGQHESIALFSAQASKLITHRTEENESQTLLHEPEPPVCVLVAGASAQMIVCKIVVIPSDAVGVPELISKNFPPVPEANA